MAPCPDRPCDRMPVGRRFGPHCHVEGCELGLSFIGTLNGPRSDRTSVCGLVYLGATDEQRRELDCAIII